jgi:uroporphyrinogen-III synthase
MNRPRVLVVRSGARSFTASASEGAPKIEIVEKVSHRIEWLDPPPSAFERPADLVLVTSRVTVERLLADGRLAPALRGAAAGARVVAVGSATGAALARRGLVADVIAGGSARSILATLPASLAGRRVLLPCAEDAAPELETELEARGAEVVRVTVYRKRAAPVDASIDRQILESPFAAFCATSPAAARWLFTGLSEQARRRLRRTPAGVLGPSTLRYLQEQNVGRIAVAPSATFASAAHLLEALATEPVGP